MRMLLSASLVLWTASCSFLSSGAREGVDEEALPKLPLELKIINERYDGARLFLQGEILAQKQWPVAAVWLRCVGLAGGIATSERTVTLRDLIGGDKEFIEAAETLPFFLECPLAESSDYQLELVWKDSLMAAEPGTTGVVPASAGLELRELRIERRYRCQTRPCKILFQVLGTLYNGSPLVIPEAVLGVRLVGKSKTGDQAEVLGEETKVALPNLDLAPQANRPFKLKIDREVLEDEHNWEPVVRIIH